MRLSELLLPDGNLQLSINPISSLPFRIEASTDLVQWETLTNYLAPQGLVQFTDRDTAQYSRRFYRAVWSP